MNTASVVHFTYFHLEGLLHTHTHLLTPTPTTHTHTYTRQSQHTHTPFVQPTNTHTHIHPKTEQPITRQVITYQPIGDQLTGEQQFYAPRIVSRLILGRTIAFTQGRQQGTTQKLNVGRQRQVRFAQYSITRRLDMKAQI